MGEPREVEFRVGRRSQDGAVRLSTYIPHLLTLSVSRRSERASTVVLTREQVSRLLQALAELEPLIESQERPAERPVEAWVGVDRRRPVA